MREMEVIDNKGDRWVVNACQACSGVVIKQYVGNGDPLGEPDNTVDVPLDILPNVLELMLLHMAQHRKTCCRNCNKADAENTCENCGKPVCEECLESDAEGVPLCPACMTALAQAREGSK